MVEVPLDWEQGTSCFGCHPVTGKASDFEYIIKFPESQLLHLIHEGTELD